MSFEGYVWTSRQGRRFEIWAQDAGSAWDGLRVLARYMLAGRAFFGEESGRTLVRLEDEEPE